MSSLELEAGWPDVPAWDETTNALGTTMNAPAQALGERTELLKQSLDQIDNPTGDKAIGGFSYEALESYVGDATHSYFVDIGPVSKALIGGPIVRAGDEPADGGWFFKDGLNRTWRRVSEGLPTPYMYGAKGGGVVDDTQALQRWADANTVLQFPDGDFFNTTDTIILSKFGATIGGEGGLYSPSTINYSGAGAAFEALAAVNYLKVRAGVHIAGKPAVLTDYYNTGSVGIDCTEGAVSIDIEGAWISGVEQLIKSNANSFYNNIRFNRFERFRIGLGTFSSNNFNVQGNRFARFNTAIQVNGNNGPTNIFGNSFEVFNGPLVQSTGNEFPAVNFAENYVEDYYEVDLPTNFPRSTSTPHVDKFGGSSLFTGFGYASLRIIGNDMQIASIFRIVSATYIRHFESKNNLGFAQAGNNIDRLYSFDPSQLTYLDIADVKTIIGTADAGFSRAYTQGSATLPTASQDQYHYFYDCFADAVRRRATNIQSVTLTNGWTSPDVTHGSLRIIRTDAGGVMLSGLIDGASKTANGIFTIPLALRPYEYGTTRSFANFSVYSAYGAGNLIRLRYLYGTGVLQIEGAPASLATIPLDGVIIPPRY